MRCLEPCRATNKGDRILLPFELCFEPGARVDVDIRSRAATRADNIRAHLKRHNFPLRSLQQFGHGIEIRVGSAISMRTPDSQQSRTFPGAKCGSPEAPFHFSLTSAFDRVRSHLRKLRLFTIAFFWPLGSASSSVDSPSSVHSLDASGSEVLRGIAHKPKWPQPNQSCIL